MKKTILLILSFVILLCCICFSGCNNQSNKSPSDQIKDEMIKAEEVKTALVEAGYSKAHTSSICVYLDSTETDTIWVTNLYGDFLPDLDFKNERDDIPQILDAVMPLYDKEYTQGDGKKIINRLKDCRIIYDGEIHCGEITFKNLKYHEFLDETNSFTYCIMVKKSET